MKKNILKLLLIVICTFLVTARSQATFTGLKKDYTESMDSLLTYVDKRPISTGILYDRVMSFTSLSMLKDSQVLVEHFILTLSRSMDSLKQTKVLQVKSILPNLTNKTK